MPPMTSHYELLTWPLLYMHMVYSPTSVFPVFLMAENSYPPTNKQIHYTLHTNKTGLQVRFLGLIRARLELPKLRLLLLVKGLACAASQILRSRLRQAKREHQAEGPSHKLSSLF